MNGQREQWTTRTGFILAAAGSAVGLGNIWRFPYVAGENGGAAFLVLYLIIIALIGYPVMLSEMTLGRKTQKNPVGAFLSMAPGTPWWVVGGMGVFAGFVILSFYSMVAGWSLAYMFKSLAGFTPGMDFVDLFIGHIYSPTEPLIWHAVFMVLTLAIIGTGVVKGIQRWVKILMPALLVLLAILVVRGLTLPGAFAGIEFYLRPDFSQITADTFLAAVGQSFFTLSLGMGAMITYGSYLKKDEIISDNAAWVVGLDTGIAIIAGFAIFPAVFALGFEPSVGAGLAFITLPAVFASMPFAGSFFSFLFFLLLSVAALTSAISLLEVVVAWLVDEKGWPRFKAALLMGITIFVIGIPTSPGIMSGFNFLGGDVMDLYELIANDIALPLGGLLTAVFVGHVWTNKKAQEEMNTPKGKIFVGDWFGVLIKYVIPIAVAVILISGLYSKFTG